MSTPNVSTKSQRIVMSVMIPADQIDDNHIYNCRGEITFMDVERLAKDIAQNGLMQPIVVRPLVNGNFKYRVVAGFSRRMAMRVLRWTEIPCVVRDCDDETAMFLNLAENLVRNDLNFMQEARAVQKIGMKFPRLNDQAIAEKLHQNRRWVHVRLFALNLPVEVQDVIAKGFVTYDQIEYIYKMKTNEEKIAAIKLIVDARERGIKMKLKRQPPPKGITKESRSREDIFQMQAHIVESLKTNNLATRALAWAAGEIDDFEFFGDLENICQAEERPYKKLRRLPKNILEEVRVSE